MEQLLKTVVETVVCAFQGVVPSGWQHSLVVRLGLVPLQLHVALAGSPFPPVRRVLPGHPVSFCLRA